MISVSGQDRASCSIYAQVLVARQALNCARGNDPVVLQMRAAAEQYVCHYVDGHVATTPDGLAWVRELPLQYAMSAAFVAMVYSDYLAAARETLSCGGRIYQPEQVGVLQRVYPFPLHC